jgi:gliding motility-associated-like protein
MLISGYGFSQSFVNPLMGQFPSNPFPICGIGEFRQLIVPHFSGGSIDITGCGKVETLDPFYYSITCYSSGKLGLLINPLDSSENFNWELFDITGHDPNEIYTNNALQVIGNWSGSYGKTGASNTGIPSTGCLSNATLNSSTFSTMPTLIQGHQYLLLVCGYSPTPGDYFISFPGTTAVIEDLQSPHMQSASVGCNKKIINVMMNKPMRCNSLTVDGSEFSINSAGVSITGAFAMNCNDQFDYDSFQITMSDTLAPGNYLLSAGTGSMGVTLFDDCLQGIIEGEQIPFTVFPSEDVSAEFSYQVGYGCKEDTIYFNYPYALNGLTSLWIIDSVFASSEPEPVITEPVIGWLLVQHIVSKGVCSDSVFKTINLDNVIKAAFQAPTTVCPGEQVTFSDKSTGNIISWNWNFGDGSFSNEQEPSAHLFPDMSGEKKYMVTLIVINGQGCSDTVSTPLTKFQSCSIAVPNAFTPNGDGKNDYLYPLNAFTTKELEFMVYNRYGQRVFESHDPAGKWDGRINGAAQPTSSYFWTLRYTDGLTGNKTILQGTTLLIR